MSKKASQDYYPDFFSHCYGCSRLNNAGLVVDVKRANCVYYNMLRCPCIVDFIGCMENVLAANADEHKKILKSCKIAQKSVRCAFNI